MRRRGVNLLITDRSVKVFTLCGWSAKGETHSSMKFTNEPARELLRPSKHQGNPDMIPRAVTVSAKVLTVGLALLLLASQGRSEDKFDAYGGYTGIKSVQHRSHSGRIASLSAGKLTDGNASFPVGGLVGKYVQLGPVAKCIRL